MFDAFDGLEASVGSGAGLLEYKHRLVEATAHFNRMNEIDSTFAQTQVGQNLARAVICFTVGPEWQGIEKVRSVSVINEFSEVTLNPPLDADFRAFKLTVANVTMKPGEGDAMLDPWVSGNDVAAAYMARALLRLDNAKVLAGRKKGTVRQEPPPRDSAVLKRITDEVQAKAQQILISHQQDLISYSRMMASRPATIDVYSWPSGAEVTIDGEVVGSTPGRFTLAPGRRSIEMAKPGYASWKTVLSVSPADYKTIETRLQK
jgi:hypothetical protein